MRSAGSRTIDGASVLRAMVVGLSDEQEAVARRAIVPVDVATCATIRDACASMSSLLPLVVVVDEGIPDQDRAALVEFTTACGAEIVAIERVPAVKEFAARLLEALSVAERRRMGSAR